MTRTDRLLDIVLRLKAHRWWRAEDLAEALGVSARTIYRDMEVLARAGVPLEGVPGSGYRLREAPFLPPLALSADEAFAVLVGGGAGEGEVTTVLEHTRERLQAFLSEAPLAEDVSGQQRLPLVPPAVFDEAGEDSTLRLVRRAVEEERALRFQENDALTRQMNPYGLVRRQGGWYVVGYDHEAERVRHVALRQMAEPELLETTFTCPPGYRHLDGEAARDQVVRVLFAPEAAPLVKERPAFYGMETEERDDGLLVTLRVRRTSDVMPWLLGWGHRAVVLEPDALRQRLAREARKMAARYDRGGPGLFS